MASETEKIILRPLQAADFALLADWINTPHVAKFWDGHTDIEKVEAKYGPRTTYGSTVKVFIACLNERAIGMIQCYEHSESPRWNKTVGIPNAIGIDYLIGEAECVGKGIGPRMIKEMVMHAFELYPTADVVVSVPQQANRASCRALEKAGFEFREARKLDSDDPSDSGISAIYAYPRHRLSLSNQ